MVAPTGNNVNDAWNQALECKSGVDKISLFPTTDLPVHIAAEVKNFDMGDLMDLKESRRTTRFVQFAIKAAAEALTSAGLRPMPEQVAERAGCVIGVGLGAIESIEENTRILGEKGAKRVSPFFLPYTIPNMAAGLVSRDFNLKGPNLCTTTACTSGTHGVGEGYLHILAGMADVMVVGGAEAAISPLSIASFASMKALSTRNDDPQTASRPFDVDRDGFVMGEGCGVLVIEEFEHAKKRGAKILAEVVGYGMSGDAHHITAPPPGGEGAQRCMRFALQSGKIPLDQVDYINAHGTSTSLNDLYETQAIQTVFGDHAKKISISSTKGVTGHCLGAAGGIEAVYTVMAIHRGVVPPTANLRNVDPACTLDYTPNQPRERKIRYALSNSFGFGGTNGTVVFKSFSA
jgi:3-oxoacyl-[acyl-carrier-protein] synthase II